MSRTPYQLNVGACLKRLLFLQVKNKPHIDHDCLCLLFITRVHGTGQTTLTVQSGCLALDDSMEE
jgi:hypothetical protein